MKYTEQFDKALAAYKNEPEKPGVFDSPFWSMLIEKICDEIHTNGSIDTILRQCTCFINYGICNEIFSDVTDITAKIENSPIKNSPLPIVTFSQWITDQANKVRQLDKKDAFTKELRTNQILLSKYNRELQGTRARRNDQIQELAEQSQSPNIKNDLQKIMNDLSIVDNLQIECYRIRKSLSKGTFYTVDQKRENASRENQLTKSLEQVKSFLDCYPSSDLITELRHTITSTAEQIQKIIELELIIEKNQTDIDTVQKAQAEVSPIEFENKIREELEHIRDMTRLSSKRMHLDNCPVLTDGKKYFTYTKLVECLNRILEFDPLLLKNDRVAIVGKPLILIVPGSGNAVYDWKNNLILIPLQYISDNPMISISSGMIEYRLDTDEDKLMLNSYNELPEYKTIRSTIQLKSQLTKDYTTWMTQEYLGYRVLPKSVKEWFEHDIGPNKNEIFVPHAYQTYNFSSTDFNKLLKSTDEKICGSSIDNAAIDDLWIGSVMWYHQGNMQRAYELLHALCSRDVDIPMAYYNYALVASKIFQKTNAIKAYTEFINRLPQCWWTRVASDHLRALQSSGT
ncbi:MAG: hypothetical protein GX639_01465 [Fibrobacter sp.]|nr:hypothetical protein [Fibrobacter sp.]